MLDIQGPEISSAIIEVLTDPTRFTLGPEIQVYTVHQQDGLRLILQTV